ncbi:MAG TPA: TlpA disulfide reductase family protein [Bryobacteraceae bacterium]|jgi:cytochrome c biogenesis protein CcmG/thiol:disulfide interchange protein DsbE|nr:TlpA disulfide reductase family protein [Bryobacteraceae bacterium]
MEIASSMDVSRWVAVQVAVLEAPQDWEPNAAAGRARLEARLNSAGAAARYWRTGAIAATSFVCVTLLVSPNARVLAEQCWRCIAGGRTEIAAGTAATNLHKTAPDFSLVDARGATVHLSDYKGKVVLLDFWATWCHPCKVEIPWFVEFERSFKDQGFAVLGVSLDEDGWKQVTPFVERNKVNYRILMGNEEVAQLYAADSLPTTLLIDREGRIAASHVGLADRAAFEREIRALLR